MTSEALGSRKDEENKIGRLSESINMLLDRKAHFLAVVMISQMYTYVKCIKYCINMSSLIC